jgi:hypothetical protein
MKRETQTCNRKQTHSGWDVRQFHDHDVFRSDNRPSYQIGISHLKLKEWASLFSGI